MKTIAQLKVNLITVLFFSFFGSLFAQQDYFIPRNIQKAFENKTRSVDGKPGENYWQNSSDYKIKVLIDLKSNLLKGSEKIIYYNNSPDTLKNIVIRTYQDLTKKGNPRDFTLNAELINDGVIIEKLSVGGEQADFESQNYGRYGTNIFYRLSKPILPKSRVDVEVDWNFELPENQLPRMGKYDSTTFFMAYWYPQISVYDDIDGWDRFDYKGQVEMYNDFANFDVEISVPNNFGVWSTGILLNPDEVLLPEFVEKYKLANSSDQVIKIITKEDYSKGKVFASNSELNVWKFRAEYVPDFAFAFSDHYLWDGVSLIVDNESGRRSFICAAYNENSKDFYDVALIARNTIEYFSNEMPGVPYPYPTMTVFNGAGGMEFPMIVNDGSTSSLMSTVGLTSHEIAHTYFPFYMGINERKYAWMDEGWAVMLPFDFQERAVKDNDPRGRNVEDYQNFAGKEMELPLMIPSVNLIGNSYRTAAYSRPGLAYDFLRDALGNDLFKKCLLEFIRRWNGKHPIPYDFFNTFDDVSGMDLNWFFIPWFFENGYPDLSIKEVNADGKVVKVLVEKKGSIPVPVSLKFQFEDGKETSIYETARIWSSGEDKLWFETENNGDLKKVILGSKQIPDSNRKDNEFILK
ncbi:MAG: M1 family metallopeptidase [Ignavibacteriaceae bacterium]|nr:M1 family metallopeptidase [Ignavibacteriaceae bacterium]